MAKIVIDYVVMTIISTPLDYQVTPLIKRSREQQKTKTIPNTPLIERSREQQRAKLKGINVTSSPNTPLIERSREQQKTKNNTQHPLIERSREQQTSGAKSNKPKSREQQRNVKDSYSS